MSFVERLSLIPLERPLSEIPWSVVQANACDWYIHAYANYTITIRTL